MKRRFHFDEKGETDKNPDSVYKNTRRRLQLNDELYDFDLHIASLLSTTCNVESCSPLITALKESDISRICFRIEHSLQELVQGDKDISFKARISVVPNIKRNDFDSDSIFVEIFQNSHDNHSDEPISRKVVFKGLFTSCDSSGNLIKKLSHTNQITQNLPVLLWHGARTFGEKVKHLLQKSLNCTIQPFKFKTYQMQIFGIIWIQQNLSRPVVPNTFNLKVEYEYPVTPRTQKSHSDTKFIAVIELLHWRDRLEQLETTPSNLKEIQGIWLEFCDTYTGTTGYQFRSANYIKLATTNCVISQDGMIKLMRKSSMEQISPILTWLTKFIERG